MNKAALLLILIHQVFIADAFGLEKYFNGYNFELSVEPAFGVVDYLGGYGGLIQVREGQEYSIKVKNPMPVRVAVALTVDGLNTIDGQRSSAEAGQKWLIEPYSTITIKGWQTADTKLRRFVFTSQDRSYAKWKGERDRRYYLDNLGMIGAAFFWNSAELNRALFAPKPMPFENLGALDQAPGAGASKSIMPDSLAKRDQAGTGMGRSEWNQVARVNFYYDSGMFNSNDALMIRYQFGFDCLRPMPHEHYRYPGNYAPEMP